LAKVLYNLSIYLYQWVIGLVSPFNKKAKNWIDGRQNIFEHIASALHKAQSEQPTPLAVAWFHCASLGEFEQGRPVIEAFKKEYPNFKIFLTFFSPSGYEVRKNYAEADFIFYLPSDTPANANRFVQLVNPQIAFFVKYEFWYNYLHTLHQKGIPAVSFSAIFRPNQIFFKSYGQFNRDILHFFSHIFVQNTLSESLLRSIGVTQISIGGDTRFDRVKQIADAKKDIPIAEKFKAGQKILIIGSCWHQDFTVLYPFINRFGHDLKVIIAPHEIHRDEIAKWQQQLQHSSVLYSEALNGKDPSQAQVLIIDNIGMLSSLYQYAEFAWIGGAYGKGLHNTLEAATFGLPIFFGNKVYTKFQEALDLIAIEGAMAIDNTNDFEKYFMPLFQQDKLREDKSKRIIAFVEQNLGSTQQVINYIKTLGINPPTQSPQSL
jgi:3-deoxy-D-manno-octulosonic-acid transferase